MVLLVLLPLLETQQIQPLLEVTYTQEPIQVLLNMRLLIKIPPFLQHLRLFGDIQAIPQELQLMLI